MKVEEWLNDYKLGCDIFDKKYRADGESFDDFISRITNNNQEYKDLILSKKFIPGGRILANRGIAGKNGIKSTYSNCYVLSVDDTIESIYGACADIARTYSYGGGCGIDISALRPKGAKVNNSAKETTGAVSFMKTFDTVTGTIGQNGRRGALMISISSEHPDVTEFVDIKKNTDEITNANISVRCSDKFMTAVENKDTEYLLHWPVDSDITKIDMSTLEYDKLYHINDIYVKKINPCKLFRTLAENNWDYAEPGILYWDNIDKYNMMSDNKEFKYAGVNPCLTGDTIVKTKEGDMQLKDIVENYKNKNIEVLTYNEDNKSVEYKSVYFGALTRKNANIIEIETEDGTKLKLTPDHKVYTENRGWIEASKLLETDILLEIYKKIRIKKITIIENEDVYDISVKDNHNFFANGVLVHNCAEEPLVDGGACLLGSMNLAAFVKDKVFQFNEFNNCVKLAVRYLNDCLDEGILLHPLKKQQAMADKYKAIGLGIMDLAGALIKQDIVYGSTDALIFCEELGKNMLSSAFCASCDLNTANIVYDNLFDSEFYKTRILPNIPVSYVGKYPRNSQLLTIAPTGTISTMINSESGGAEPIFALSYTRMTKSLHGKDVVYEVHPPLVDKYIKENGATLPAYFVASNMIDYKDRISMQAVLQKYIDASISSTINLDEKFTVDGVYDLYLTAWKKHLKGVTIYRRNCKRSAILDDAARVDTVEKDMKFDYIEPLTRTDLGKKLEGVSYKCKNACGGLYLQINNTKDNHIVEIFANPTANGGCHANLAALARQVSSSLRSGIKVESIIKSLSKVQCQACIRAKAKGEQLDGNSCADIMSRCLKERYEELNTKIEDIDDDSLEECPECHCKSVKREAGCKVCSSCGWSKCN